MISRTLHYHRTHLAEAKAEAKRRESMGFDVTENLHAIYFHKHMLVVLTPPKAREVRP